MKKAKWILVGVALVAVLALGAACDTGTEPTTPPGGVNIVLGTRGDASSFTELTSAELSGLARSLALASGVSVSSGQSGIWVTGRGKATLEPDLAVLSLGVETRADTVEVARAEAAAAMVGIRDALKERGIADRDIQTRYFNIYPEYTYQEIYEDSLRYNKQVLTGYRVSNSVTIKVRDLDILGVAIDEVVAAGGDATRINGIQFTIEDASAAQTQAREEAVLDALAKADQFANLTGVTRGSLLFITEAGGSVPVVYDYGVRAEGAFTADSAPTPISTGELEVQASVQAVFAIEAP